jgi:hypothetical protein
MIRFALLCAGLLASVNIFALEIRCPEKIVTTQTLVKQESGWQEFVRPTLSGANENNWSIPSRIALYDGNPKEIAELKPDDSAKKSTWRFTEPSPANRPIYMSCVYSNTRIEFIKALPLNIKKCTETRAGVLRCEAFKP